MMDQEGLSSYSLTHIVYPFTAGILVTLFCQYVIPLRHCPSNPLMSPLIGLRKKADHGQKLRPFEQKDHYGLEHRLLNLKTEPESMWLNVGFWKNNPCFFQEACQHLFEEVLCEAGISKGCSSNFSIVEVGCGCAETAFFMRKSLPHKLRDYIGITINRSQARYAKDRLQSLADDCPLMYEGRGSPLNEVFKADAADPNKWPSHVHNKLHQLAQSRMGPKNSEAINPQLWLLAIDTLYHFKPNRHKILKYAHQELGASIMATDIIISSSLSTWNRVLLRILFYFLYVPWTNILTRDEYISMLAACGYEKKNIEIRDITEDCFPGYDQFLARQSRHWEHIGGSPAVFRPMRLMGKVAAWWAKSGTIRECIIIAKKSGSVP